MCSIYSQSYHAINRVWGKIALRNRMGITVQPIKGPSIYIYIYIPSRKSERVSLMKDV